MKIDIFSRLTPQNAFIAKELIEQGFPYTVIAKDYPSDEIIDLIEGWGIESTYRKESIDCAIDVMFCCEIDEEETPLVAVLFSTKVAIQAAVEKWQKLNGEHQLDLPL